MENCFKNARVSHLQIVSVERIQKFQETKFSRNVTHGSCSKISRSKIGNLTHGFFSRHAREQNHQIVPMKKSQEAKFQILFMEKFQKIQETKFENKI